MIAPHKGKKRSFAALDALILDAAAKVAKRGVVLVEPLMRATGKDRRRVVASIARLAAEGRWPYRDGREAAAGDLDQAGEIVLDAARGVVNGWGVDYLSISRLVAETMLPPESVVDAVIHMKRRGLWPWRRPCEDVEHRRACDLCGSLTTKLAPMDEDYEIEGEVCRTCRGELTEERKQVEKSRQYEAMVESNRTKVESRRKALLDRAERKAEKSRRDRVERPTPGEVAKLVAGECLARWRRTQPGGTKVNGRHAG